MRVPSVRQPKKKKEIYSESALLSQHLNSVRVTYPTQPAASHFERVEKESFGSRRNQTSPGSRFSSLRTVNLERARETHASQAGLATHGILVQAYPRFSDKTLAGMQECLRRLTL